MGATREEGRAKSHYATVQSGGSLAVRAEAAGEYFGNQREKNTWKGEAEELRGTNTSEAAFKES